MLLSDLAVIHAEIAGLRAKVGRLADGQSSETKAITSDPPLTERISITGDGSGAGSPEVYRDMVARAWTGRLGRTHMVDVDQMSVPVKKELDCYLRRTIHKMFPVGSVYVTIDQDTVFATLAVFGLRLEDRGTMADVQIYSDEKHQDKPPLSRMQNYGSMYLRNGGNWDNYWKGSAIETLIELARYRGLFNGEGFLSVWCNSTSSGDFFFEISGRILCSELKQLKPAMTFLHPKGSESPISNKPPTLPV